MGPINRIEQIALRSIDWRTEERFSFIWDEQLLVANYDRDRKYIHILSHVKETTREEIKSWFYRLVHQTLEVEDEENRY